MWQDIQFSWRLLLRTPMYSLVTILVLALGIGLSTQGYNIIKNFAFTDIDVPDGERMVAFGGIYNGSEMDADSLSEYVAYYVKERQTKLDRADIMFDDGFNIGFGEYTQRYWSARVTDQFFRNFPVEPLLGRTFIADDMAREGSRVMVISEIIWEEHFDRSEDVLGRTLQVNGQPHEVIGVLPKSFRAPEAQFAWMPLYNKTIAEPHYGIGDFALYGFLKPGVTLAASEAEVKALFNQVKSDYPKIYDRIGIRIWWFTQGIMNNSMGIIYSLIGGGLFIFALAIANVSNLLIVRAQERQKELAIRSAVGAKRTSLIRLILVDSILIGSIGGFVSICIAGYALEVFEPIIRSFAGYYPFWWDFSLTADTVIFGLSLIALTILITAIVPAIKVYRVPVMSILRDGTQGAQGKEAGLAVKIMVVFETTLATALVFISIAFGLTIYSVNNIDLGSGIENRVVAEVQLDKDRYQTMLDRHEFYKAIRQQVLADPMIREASIAKTFTGRWSYNNEIFVEGMVVGPDESYPQVNDVRVDEQYMQMMNIQLLSGRHFTHEDDHLSDKVAIISTTFMAQHFPEETVESVIGKQFQINPKDKEAEEIWVRVIGTIKNIVHNQAFVRERDIPVMYRPFWQSDFSRAFIVVKGSEQSAPYIEAIQNAVSKVDPLTPTYNQLTIKKYMERNAGGVNFIAMNFNIMAMLALVLTASGIFAVLSRSVVLRTNEIGVRRALGATSKNIMSMFLIQSSKQLILGLGAGLAIGYLMMVAISSLMVDLPKFQLIATIIVIVSVSLTVLMATWVPTRKAINIEPNQALRYE